MIKGPVNWVSGEGSFSLCSCLLAMSSRGLSSVDEGSARASVLLLARTLVPADQHLTHMTSF